MKNVLIIFKKELKRFFTDIRMIASMFLPGILIFIMYSLMGKFMTGNMFQSNISNVTYKIAYSDNYSSDKSKLPALMTYLDGYVSTEKNNKVDYVIFNNTDLSTYLDKLKTKEFHLRYTDVICHL